MKNYVLGELEAEHKEKVVDLEQKINVKLKERQEIFNQVFQQDMRQYIISGIIPVMKSSGESSTLSITISHITYKVTKIVVYR